MQPGMRAIRQGLRYVAARLVIDETSRKTECDKSIKENQDASRCYIYRSELCSSETYGNGIRMRSEEGERDQIHFSIFGIRMNKKVREQRDTSTMLQLLEEPLICIALKRTNSPKPVCYCD